jgi:hypothetical protein
LRRAVEAAQEAVTLDSSEENSRALAQAANVSAERILERGGNLEAARALVTEAAGRVGVEPPADAASADELRRVAGEVRARLGVARPAFRPGR